MGKEHKHTHTKKNDMKEAKRQEYNVFLVYGHRAIIKRANQKLEKTTNVNDNCISCILQRDKAIQKRRTKKYLFYVLSGLHVAVLLTIHLGHVCSDQT